MALEDVATETNEQMAVAVAEAAAALAAAEARRSSPPLLPPSKHTRAQKPLGKGQG